MKNSPNHGFTLIELLIVLSIIAILTSLGYPSCKHYLEESRRLDGQTALMDLANRMEHYYSEHNSYSTATIATNPDTDIFPSEVTQGEWYILSIISQDDNNYTLQATPQNAQIDDIECQSLTLNTFGEKNITAGPSGNPTGTVEKCW